jgi:hypothetical protein
MGLLSTFRLGCFLLAIASFPASAVSPYVAGYQFRERGVVEVMRAVESRLKARHFEVVGHYFPAGLPDHGTLIVSEKHLLESIRQIGGSAIVGAGIRVGVRSDGATFYMNPDYWYRAYFRRRFESVQPMVADVQRRLGQALGTGTPFGGDESPLDLADYRYLIGMEKFDSPKNALRVFTSFEAAVRTIRANLGARVANTALVYEIVLADRKLAVFGVAMNDPRSGDASWVRKLGPDHIAALPYEIYVVGNQAGALYGRYRIALGWPALGMNTFMGIRDAPALIRDTLASVTGERPQGAAVPR